MDVLADRKTAGHTTGEVKVNGFDKNPASFARFMGYCEQFDVHCSGTTVKEAIEISAILRLSKDISKEQARPSIACAP
jgi:ABC-type multidrug transport system ATPase subunit